jgi:hypothetical protein
MQLGTQNLIKYSVFLCDHLECISFNELYLAIFVYIHIDNYLTHSVA